MLGRSGKLEEAEALLRRVLELARRHGEQHDEHVEALVFLADNLRSQERYREALPLFRQAIALKSAARGLA